LVYSQTRTTKNYEQKVHDGENKKENTDFVYVFHKVEN